MKKRYTERRLYVLLLARAVRIARGIHLGPGTIAVKVTPVLDTPTEQRAASIVQRLVEYQAATECVGVAGGCPVCFEDILAVIRQNGRMQARFGRVFPGHHPWVM